MITLRATGPVCDFCKMSIDEFSPLAGYLITTDLNKKLYHTECLEMYKGTRSHNISPATWSAEEVYKCLDEA